MSIATDLTATVLDQLETLDTFGYKYHSLSASEPAAFVAFAMMAQDRMAQAEIALEWLRGTQGRDGSVGVTRNEQRPAWPTSLAIAAWNRFHQITGEANYAVAIENGRQWLLQMEGHTMPRPSESSHDTTLLGWPWAEGTHSWLEPTAYCVLSLKAIGDGNHPRTREAVRLLTDRQIPGGGCNYGNTFVLGQTMMPHIQPSGIALLALAGEPSDPRVTATVGFLERKWPTTVGTASTCFSAMGLAAHNRTPTDLNSRLRATYDSLKRRQGNKIGAYGLALLALATLDRSNPLIIQD